MRLLTAKEVAPILRVTPARVYELAREHAIPAVRMGERQVRFDEAALRDWVASGGNIQATNSGNHISLASGGGV